LLTSKWPLKWPNEKMTSSLFLCKNQPSRCGFRRWVQIWSPFPHKFYLSSAMVNLSPRKTLKTCSLRSMCQRALIPTDLNSGRKTAPESCAVHLEILGWNFSGDHISGHFLTSKWPLAKMIIRFEFSILNCITFIWSIFWLESGTSEVSLVRELV
jgi:hypothetical protein